MASDRALRPLGLLLGLALLALTACGGPSRADFIDRADRICGDINDRFRAAGRLPDIDVRYVTAAQLPAAEAYLDRVLPIFRDESAQLRGLGEPAEGEGTVHEMLSQLDQLVGQLEEADRQGRRGDAGHFTIALLKGLAWGGQAQDLASQYGFRVCGRLPALGQ